MVHARRAASRGRAPLGTLGAIVAIPSLALAGVCVWAAGDAEPQPPDASAQMPVGAVSLATPVLSLRRAPEALSAAWSGAALARELAPVVESIDDPSCLLVDVGGTPVRAVRPEVPVIPASNMKILTAGVLLDLVGPDFRYVTRVVGDLGVDGTVDGDLVLVGGGDPLLATEWYPESFAATRYVQEPATSLEDLADAVVAAGVTAVRGDVVGDESRYDDEYFRPGWDDDLRVAYAGPYSALLVDDGRLASGGVAEVPALSAARVFRGLLEDRGVRIDGDAATGRAPEGVPDIATVSSAPLVDVMRHMLHTSDNSSAEMMVKEIAVASGRPGTSDDGLAALVDHLAALGVPVEGVAPRDGSGLDIDDLATCRALVEVLASAGPDSPLVTSMPRLGVDGTLAGILADHPLAGSVRAKTGSLGQSADRTDVKALSGVHAPDGAPAVSFSLLLNGGTVSEEATYLPIWRDLADALASYPGAPPAVDLAPRPPLTGP